MIQIALLAAFAATALASPAYYGYNTGYAPAKLLAPAYATPNVAYVAPAYATPKAAYAAPVIAEPVYAEKPSPYNFGYNIDDGYGNNNHHSEEGDSYGNKKGSYGYTDAYGIYRKVDYIADDYGFRATITTNEPGTADSNPANAKIIAKEPVVVHAAPAYAAPYAVPAPAYAHAAPVYAPHPQPYHGGYGYRPLGYKARARA